jgi:hypothetical protein
MHLFSPRFPYRLMTRQDLPDEKTGIFSLIASYATYPAVEMEQFARMSASGKSGILWTATVCTRMFQS